MTEAMSAYDRQVFINCPFDVKYVPILHSVTFTLLFLGFTPRSALESDESGQERLGKIISIIKDCKYGIHDISRVEFGGDVADPLPRYNMPFECGLFFGAREFGARQHKAKKILILDSVEHRAKKTMSDIAGKDTGHHGGDPLQAIACIRRFFKDKPGVKDPPGDGFLRQLYQDFLSGMDKYLDDKKISPAEISQLTYWVDFVEIANSYLIDNSPFQANGGAGGGA